MGMVILLTPPLYKCFYGNDSTTEMLPHKVFITMWSLHDLLTINKIQEEKQSTLLGPGGGPLWWTQRGLLLESLLERAPRHTTDMIQEMVRDCRYDTGDGQRLQTNYKRWPETADILQEMVKDWWHDIRNGQRQHFYKILKGKTKTWVCMNIIINALGERGKLQSVLQKEKKKPKMCNRT